MDKWTSLGSPPPWMDGWTLPGFPSFLPRQMSTSRIYSFPPSLATLFVQTLIRVQDRVFPYVIYGLNIKISICSICYSEIKTLFYLLTLLIYLKTNLKTFYVVCWVIVILLLLNTKEDERNASCTI
jgi:hypothetical protein